MARNPYDRRDRENRDIMMNAGVDWQHGHAMTGIERPRARALAIEDLEALAFSARQRGHQAATERLEAQHRESLQAAAREAWEDGYNTGHPDGRKQLLDAIDGQHGAAIRALVTQSGDLLDDHGPGIPGNVTKAQLVAMVNKLHLALGDLLDAHHRGFEPDPAN